MIVPTSFNSNIEEQSPFIQACYKGDLQTVVTLADANPQLIATASAIPPWIGLFPLMIATRKRHKDIVSFLLEKGADPNAYAKFGDFQGESPLVSAVFSKQLDLVRKLLDFGANPNISPESGPHQGKTALWTASLTKQSDMVGELLNKGADPNASPTAGNHLGRTALEFAVIFAANDSIRTLLSFGASLDKERIKNLLCQSAHFCPYAPPITPIIMYYRLPLLNADTQVVNVTYQDPRALAYRLLQAANALFVLAEKPIESPKADLEIIDDLVGILGIGLNARKNGKTAAQTALEKGNVLLAQQLAIYGADLTGIPDCDNAIVNIFAALQQLEKLAHKIEKEEANGLPQSKIKGAEETKEEQDKENQESASQKKFSSLQEKASCLTARLKEVANLRSKIRDLTRTLNIGNSIEDIIMGRLKKTDSAVNKLKDDLLHVMMLMDIPSLEMSLEQDLAEEINETKIKLAVAVAESQLLFNLLSEYVCDEYMSLTSTLYADRDEVLSAMVLKANKIIKDKNTQVTTLSAENKRLQEEVARLKSQVSLAPSYLPSSTARPSSDADTEASQTSESTNLRKRKLDN